jgi:hypothetical protein
MERYDKVDEIPEWYRETVRKLVEWNALRGDEQGKLNLSEDMARVFVVLDRLGVLDAEE